MNDEQFQRQMDFIVAQQATFSADIAELKEQNKTNTANIAKLGELILSLANHAQEQDEQIAELIEAGKETDRRFRETDERIGILIKVVERFYGETEKNNTLLGRDYQEQGNLKRVVS